MGISPGCIAFPGSQKGKKFRGKLNFIAFSTPLWLTCPWLNDKIHRLEDVGCIKKIECLIQNDEGFLEAMRKAHVHYALLRKKLYLQFVGDLDYIEPNDKLMSSGVGGIKMYDTIKCLHLHYAHYSIYPENYVGKITSVLLGKETHCRGDLQECHH